MKLAREITEVVSNVVLDDMIGEYGEHFTAKSTKIARLALAEKLAPIVAGKLEPMKKALVLARPWVSSQIEYTGSEVKDPCETALKVVDEALDLLAEFPVAEALLEEAADAEMA